MKRCIATIGIKLSIDGKKMRNQIVRCIGLVGSCAGNCDEKLDAGGLIFYLCERHAQQVESMKKKRSTQ